MSAAASASPVRRFRKKPVEVEMIRWTGENEAEVRDFAALDFHAVDAEDAARSDDPDITAEVYDKLHSTWVGVKTGHWIVRGVKGELYPLDNEVLQETYEPAGDEPDAEETAAILSDPDTMAAIAEAEDEQPRADLQSHVSGMGGPSPAYVSDDNAGAFPDRGAAENAL